MQGKNIDLSIIILNYNTFDGTVECLDSVVRTKTASDRWEILLIDNGSEYGDGERLKKYVSRNSKLSTLVRVIVNEKNVGFAAGNNIGIKSSHGDYILLLNSDTVVSEGSIAQSLNAIKADETIGALTCKLVLPGGAIDPACHRGFPTPWASLTYFIGLEKLFPHSRIFSRYHLGFRDATTIHEIDSPSGAFFLVSKKVIRSVGLLDEAFFMYGEDIDWAYRIKKRGFKILYFPIRVINKIRRSNTRRINQVIIFG